MRVSQYCKHKWTIVTKQFIVLYLHHNGVKSRPKVYYRAQRPGGPVCSLISGQVIAPLCRKNQHLVQFQHLQVTSEKVGLLCDQLRILPAWLQTNEAACWYRAALLRCTYNNIALWRSPEHTGKCRLCASTGRGGVRTWICLYSPNNSPCWGLVRGWKGLMWYFKGAVVHLHASPSGLTRCESLQRGSMVHVGMWHVEGELKLRGAGDDGCMHIRCESWV